MFGARTDLYFYNGNELSTASSGVLDLRKDSLFPFFVCRNLFNATPKDRFSDTNPTSIYKLLPMRKEIPNRLLAPII